MATYKVIQDIEAEDKLLGPMTLRQFIYAVIVVVMGFIAFRLALVGWYLALPFVPGIVLFAVLAAPFGHDQPSEVWLLAKIRFALKPRKRIWNQSGIKELVTVTAPKRVEKHYTDGLSQTEVKSRLRALADTIDSRGWAVKNVNVNMFSQPNFAMAGAGSDRLVEASSLPQEVPGYEVMASDDMLDAQNNPAAQQLNQLMMASAQSHRQAVIATMQPGATPPPAASSAGQPANDYWFMHQPDAAQLPNPGYAAFGAQTIAPNPDAGQAPAPGSSLPPLDEAALLDKLRAQNPAGRGAAYGHTKVISPLGSQPAAVAPPAAPSPVTLPPEPAILELAGNDDLNVATIAREAERACKKPAADEIVISLR